MTPLTDNRTGYKPISRIKCRHANEGKIMNQQRQMRVSELATVTGVSVSTIHFYTKEGLLPKPFKTGQTMAYYTDEHLRSLHMIKSLRDAKYSIAAIKRNNFV